MFTIKYTDQNKIQISLPMAFNSWHGFDAEPYEEIPYDANTQSTVHTLYCTYTTRTRVFNLERTL